jgi:pimeloyl-ACP methyl ester carboxylesterase
MPPAIIIGFVGGFVKHDNPNHSEVQLAARLRKVYPSEVQVETFESYHEGKARKTVMALLDANHDGTLTPDEKKNARIIIYGHSWGGLEAIILARELETYDIPVLLTIQVDSIARIHQDGAVIPANVRKAANFYQPNGYIHGESRIRAADPGRTTILGNFRLDYKSSPYTCEKYPWYDRVFAKSHTQIECDPSVWARAEALIRSELPPARTGPER